MKKRLKKTHKCIITFFKKTLKNYVTMKTNIKKIWLFAAICICICACGTTKVKVNRPDHGTYTTITVTTNNPISTSTDAQVENDMKLKGE